MHCGPGAPPTRDEREHAARAKGSSPRWWAKRQVVAGCLPQRVDGARAGYRPAGVLCGSNLARIRVRDPLGADAAAHSPGAAWRSQRRSIDTARAMDRDDTCGCWLHTPRAGSRRLLGGTHAGATAGQQDSAVSHRAGEQSLDPRSGPLSRISPPAGEHSPRQEPCAVQEVTGLVQIRSCGPARAEADAPTPGAGSRSIG